MNFCSTRRNEISIYEFVKELANDLSRDRADQMVIVHGNLLVGTIFTYGLSRTDAFAYITIYIDHKFEKMGYGAEAFVVYLEYVFKKFELYKIYADVYEYNEHSLGLLKSGKFVPEGRFIGHRKIDDRRHDLLRLAFYATQLPEISEFVGRLSKGRK